MVRPTRAQGETEADFFERIGSNAWSRYLDQAERRAVKRAHHYAQEPMRVLDIGAGNGRWSTMLHELGWQPVCADVDERSLAACRERLPQATCLLMRETDRQFALPDQSCGMLVCIEVLHVISTEWFIQEAARLLAPGGVLVGVFGNRRSARGAYRHLHYRISGSRGLDYYSCSYPRWKRALEVAGFELLEEEGLGWFPFSRGSDSRLIRPLVALERRLGLGRLPNLSPWVTFVARKSPASADPNVLNDWPKTERTKDYSAGCIAIGASVLSGVMRSAQPASSCPENAWPLQTARFRFR